MSGRILLADDDIEAMVALAELLEAEGFTVVACAADGDEAVDLAMVTRPDVALLDVRMPIMDGVQSAAAIRRRLPNTVVVLITAYEDERAHELTRNADVFCILLKDASPDLLVHVVRRAAAHGTGARGAGAPTTALPAEQVRRVHPSWAHPSWAHPSWEGRKTEADVSPREPYPPLRLVAPT